MKTPVFAAIFLAFSLFQTSSAQAHEVRPGFLQLKQINEHTYDLLWKIPAKGDRRLSLYVRIPRQCQSNDVTSRIADGAYIERRQVSCKGGLTGETIAIDGLQATKTDVLARVEHTNGQTQTIRLTPSEPEFTVFGSPQPTAVVRTYFKLGIGHILLGFDHLLFVLALLFLVDGWRRLVGTITAFTVAHSLTLAAATFGWVQVPQAPVEAVIALSIMFVAVEVLHRRQGKEGLASRRPWVLAFVFGLLHGLGFAGALREIGLPDQAIPMALVFFNLGVETGQLIFVAAVFLIFWLVSTAVRKLVAISDRSVWFNNETIYAPISYAIGILSGFWFIERTVNLFI
jgi:hydrogenase/urease accessory protein HupE